MVLHPDILLSGTVVATALQCTRRAWLQERFGGTPGDKALLGTLGHELLQRAVAAIAKGEQGVDASWLQRTAEEVISAAGEKLLEVGLSEAVAAEALARQMPAITAWVTAYMPANPLSYQQVQQQQQLQLQQGCGRGDAGAGGDGSAAAAAAAAPLGGPLDAGSSMGAATARACITSVADIEENIWAPKFGLKGQLDASLVIQLSEVEPARSAAGRSMSWPQARQGGGGSGSGGIGVMSGSGGGGGSFSGGAGAAPGVFRGWGSSSGGGRGGSGQGGQHPLAPLDTNQPGFGQAAGSGDGRVAGKALSGGGGSGGGANTLPPAAAEAAAQGLVITRQQQLLVPFEFKTGKDYFTHRCAVFHTLIDQKQQQAPLPPLVGLHPTLTKPTVLCLLPVFNSPPT